MRDALHTPVCALRVAARVFCALSALAAPQYARADDGQLLSPIETVVVGSSGGVEQVVFGQRAVGDRLMLVPDTCFFSGEGLRLAGTQAPRGPESALNGDKSFTRIEGLQSPAQRVLWPLWIYTPGAATVTLWCESARGDVQLTVQLAGQAQTLAISSSRGDQPQPAMAEFAELPTGMQQLVLSAAGDRGPWDGAVLRVEVRGPAVHEALLLRARWRPAAIHSHFASSSLQQAGASSEMWVMEERPIPGEKGFYGPITTPFGYYGSTFNPDGTSGGVNFSMWSFGAGAREPPLEQLSHLLAVGDPRATFGGFSHEGTGVKPRGWNPYEGRRLSSVVQALRVQRGETYDTYTGYFLDPQSRAWRLFASGRKWVDPKKKRADSLLPACFVEVPGPPQVERSGHIVRAADFRGWCRDTEGRWHPLDEMLGSKADVRRGETSALWSATPDGWFHMAMGGMIHYRYQATAEVRVPESKTLPDFLAPQCRQDLDRLPTTLAHFKAQRQGRQVVMEFDLAQTGAGPSRLKALFGKTDGLSFEPQWEHVKDLGEFLAGHHRAVLPEAGPSGYCRLVATNAGGIYVTPEPAAWK